MLTTLMQKARGYTQDEITAEYQIDESGARHLTKEKVVTKYYAPDTTALKTYMELKKDEEDLSHLTDEELVKKAKAIVRRLSKKETK